MSYQGDIRVGQVLYFHFTTRKFSTGAPVTGDSLAISVYKDDSTTQSTSGVTTTFTSGFDGVAGLVSVKVDTSSDGTFYAAGHDFSVVVTGGTADSVSIVGEVVGGFSIENRSALMPTTSGRKLDVSAGGEAGIDWANVGGPTTAVDLSNTTIKTTQKVDVDTIKTNPVVNGGTLTFPSNATLASTTNITAGTVTTATNVTTLNGIANNVITSASINDGAITAAKIADAAIDAATFASGALDAVWSTTTRLLTAGTNIVLAKGTGITGFNDLSASQVNAEADTALADYDGPTHAELTAELATADDAVLAAIAALNNLSAAQVNAEVDTALADINLDHLIKIAVDTDFPTTVHLNSVIGQIADNGTSATFDRTTDSLEAIRDRGDAAWITATGFSTHSAADVWAVGTRLLTAGTNIVLAKGTGITGFNDLSAAQVNAEADTALADVGVTGTVTGRIDAAISSRLASGSYTAPDNASITAIKNKTDSLTFTNPGEVDANVQAVNDVELTGTGVETTDEWRPA